MYQYLQWINQNCDIVTGLVAKWKEMNHFLLKIWYSDVRWKIKNSFFVFLKCHWLMTEVIYNLLQKLKEENHLFSYININFASNRVHHFIKDMLLTNLLEMLISLLLYWRERTSKMMLFKTYYIPWLCCDVVVPHFPLLHTFDLHSFLSLQSAFSSFSNN